MTREEIEQKMGEVGPRPTPPKIIKEIYELGRELEKMEKLEKQ
jgi:hypothetical protein